MSYDDLVCAACSGRVVDGGCPTCRASRQLLSQHTPQLPAGALLALAVALTLLLLVLAHLQ